jgi:hypothetical protein
MVFFLCIITEANEKKLNIFCHIKWSIRQKIEKQGKRKKIGAGEEIRTLDSHLGKVALYQLSYTRSQKAVAETNENKILCKFFLKLN